MGEIRTLLEHDPDREVISVVKINDHDPKRVWTEMDEYVPTEEIRSYFRDFLDRYVESRRSDSEVVCSWVSGFFGSGKSHFLKVLGYFLENKALQGPQDQKIPSTDFLCSKLGFPQLAPLLTRELKCRVIYINLLDKDPQAQAIPTISRLIYREVLASKGLSTDFWVAAWEEEIQALNKWDDFLSWVTNHYGRSWQEERRLNADSILTRALVHLLPARYPNESTAQRAIDDSKQRFQEVRPSEIVDYLCREATALDPSKGRLVVLLDEAGLYVGDSVDRLTDLNILAEQVSTKSRGKIWLIVSAQESLAELVPRLTSDRQILGWLQDRFRLRYQLTPANIEQVVSERLLKKSPAAVTTLNQLFEQTAGVLAAGAAMQNVSSGRLSTNITKERFVSSYPMLPYHVLLLQEIFSALRQRGQRDEIARRRLAGRERSMLQTVHAVLRGEGELPPFVDQPIGGLVTLDLLYDAISTELSIIQSDHHNAITNRVNETVNSEGLSCQKVAKALFLLQQVGEWLPCSSENLAAMLCPSVSVDVHAHRESVKRTLALLEEAGWVIEEEGKYRFLSPAEHDFEQDVRGNLPTGPEKKLEITKILKQKFQQLLYRHGERSHTPLDVKKVIDLQPISETGDLSICFYSPLAEKEKDDVITESLSSPDTVFWLAQNSSEIETHLIRALSIKKAFAQWRGRTFSTEQDHYMSRLRNEKNDILEVTLPQQLEKVFLDGLIITAGVEDRPEGGSLGVAFQNAIRQVAGNIFTEFLDIKVERDEDCAKIIRWRPGASLTPAYHQLNIIGASGVNADCEAASLLRSELLRRGQEGLERSGGALVDHFRKKPYGWGHQLVRLIAACLFKNGNISIEQQALEITDVNDPRVMDIFTGFRQFRTVKLKVLPSVDWRRARELLVELTGGSARNTFEGVSEEVGHFAEQWSRKAEHLAIRSQDLNLPDGFIGCCTKVEEALSAVRNRTEPNARLREFLEKEELLRQHIPLFKKIREFEDKLDRYRQLSEYIREANGWARELEGEMKTRWQSLADGLGAADLVDRFSDLETAYQVLVGSYRDDYNRRHGLFNEKIGEALTQLKGHPILQNDVDLERHLLAPLFDLVCEQETVGEDSLRCLQCQRSYNELRAGLVETIKLDLERVLDGRIIVETGPGPIEMPEPLLLNQTLTTTEGIDAIVHELKNYVRRGIVGGRRVQVEVKATPKEEEAQ